MNIYDILILALVAAAVVCAALVIRRNRKKGRCSCGCDGCGNTNCGMRKS